ncbi:ClbS/DfsB family four-helix bundle protein [Microbulbifer sp. OS29]|uniref:ClbS/DfsB family four-helix bundle protein n=1 Tax=Microbulbifer okhotskensis TaxID=2926617 RepID=A0A9X2ETR1_9GAMM|nr:ClbS/DfsB family four-helix bundle protein [Microbulbifer okhotskensis]MCO1335388.1 ClbS/DfsB family four-helix bundle protein [Microbulbifer okhotskensis]
MNKSVMSSIPKNKEELLQAIRTAFDKLLADYLEIPEEHSRQIGVEGNTKNTEISICDTLSYLIGWGKLVLKWYDLTSRGLEADFPETGYQWNELGQLASHLHSQYQDWSFERLLSEFQSTTEQILRLVESQSNDELYARNWYKNYTLGKMIQFNTSSPMKNIRTKVRKFKKLKCKE